MSFITGCVGVGRTLGVLAQLEADDDKPVDAWQVGFWADGRWRSELTLDFKPVALSPFVAQPDTWVVLGVDGNVLWIEGASAKQPNIRRHRIGDGSLPAFTAVRDFGIGLVATGMGRRVHWSDGSGWQLLGRGLVPDHPGELVGFEAMATVEGELYVCGWGGEIWFLKDGVWERVDTSTNIILTGAAAHPRGEVIICGRLGTILHGRREQWALVEHQQTNEDFWSVATFQGRTYCSSMRTIYELVGQRLIPVDDGSTSGSYYHLSANNMIMASIGADAVSVTDGEDWNEII